MECPTVCVTFVPQRVWFGPSCSCSFFITDCVFGFRGCVCAFFRGINITLAPRSACRSKFAISSCRLLSAHPLPLSPPPARGGENLDAAASATAAVLEYHLNCCMVCLVQLLLCLVHLNLQSESILMCADGDFRCVREAGRVPQARAGSLQPDGVAQGGGCDRHLQRGRHGLRQGTDDHVYLLRSINKTRRDTREKFTCLYKIPAATLAETRAPQNFESTPEYTCTNTVLL